MPLVDAFGIPDALLAAPIAVGCRLMWQELPARSRRSGCSEALCVVAAKTHVERVVLESFSGGVGRNLGIPPPGLLDIDIRYTNGVPWICERRAMVILETSVFTRQVRQILEDDDYRGLQLTLVERPDAGALIRGSGGLRKFRWPGAGRGKRGGLRIVYYWAVAEDQLLMLFLYPKSEREDLTREQLKRLKAVIEDEYP